MVKLMMNFYLESKFSLPSAILLTIQLRKVLTLQVWDLVLKRYLMNKNGVVKRCHNFNTIGQLLVVLKSS